LLIYTHHITSRVRYCFDFVFGHVLRIPYEITTDKSIFLDYSKAKINYSNTHFGNELFIAAHPLLTSNGVKSYELIVTEWKGKKIFFQTGKDSFLPFDIFAATFYLISRYEEYLDFVPDRFGRFPAEQSIAASKNFLDYPIVNEWIMIMADEIKKQYPLFTLPQHNFSYIPTIDVDHCYSYKCKGILRNACGFIRSFFAFDITGILTRIRVLTGRMNDPFNTFELIYKLYAGLSSKPVFFFQVGRYGKYDKNVSVRNHCFRDLINQTAQYGLVGLHPSFQSNKSIKLLMHEKRALESVTEYPVIRSRQHYLKITLPQTYQRLLAAGITEDYSMGYPDRPGFRAGTCTPFFFYDLETEKATELKIFPFQVMDVMFKKDCDCDTGRTLVKIKQMIDRTAGVSGVFISVWHNDNFFRTGNEPDLLSACSEMIDYLKTKTSTAGG